MKSSFLRTLLDKKFEAKIRAYSKPAYLKIFYAKAVIFE